MKFKLLDLVGDKPHTVSELAHKLNSSPREVRRTVSALACEGYAIGTHPDIGIFYIYTEEDAKKALQHLRPRATAIFRRLRVLERTCKEKFGNQIRLCEVTHET